MAEVPRIGKDFSRGWPRLGLLGDRKDRHSEEKNNKIVLVLQKKTREG
jgi:hypothetical protein